jgi:hypothetical protein
MYKEDRRFGIVPYPDITNLPALRLIVGEMWFNMTGMKPIGEVLIIHPELHQPVEDKHEDDKEDQYA